jgi:hypothetical protein
VRERHSGDAVHEPHPQVELAPAHEHGVVDVPRHDVWLAQRAHVGLLLGHPLLHLPRSREVREEGSTPPSSVSLSYSDEKGAISSRVRHGAKESAP